MRRQKKVNQVKALEGLFQGQRSFYLLDYRRMNVAQSMELRKILKRHSYSFKVIKNRLALRALNEEYREKMRPYFQNPTAVAFAPQDPIGLARLIKNFSAQEKVLTVKGGIIEGKIFPAEKFEEIAKLPSREELLGKIGSMMAYPLIRLLRTWQAPLINLGRLLSQLSTHKK